MPAEWFAARGGLRFSCTQCGNCCSGPPGYVLYTEAEGEALARRLGVTVDEFVERYTEETIKGRSLKEIPGPKGNDCVFLDRESVPGRALCSVYEERPGQCRTWPFWPSVVRSERTWERAKGTCPGMDRGVLVPVERVRILRDAVNI